MISYPFTHSFDYPIDGTNGTNFKTYTLELDVNKTVLKLGWNESEELFEQLRFDLMCVIDGEEKLELIVHREFTTSSGKVQKSEELRIVSLSAEFQQFSQAFWAIRCIISNSIFQNFVTMNENTYIFNPLDFTLLQ